MPRRTISVGAKTWEALSAIGRFGQSYDDIIQILLQEHEELKQLKSQLSQPTQPKQAIKTAASEIEEYKQHTRNPHLHIFDKDTAQPIPIGEFESGKRNLRMEMIFPEIKFPVKKHELVEQSKNDNDKQFLKVFNALPDKTFTTKDELEYSIIEVFSNNKDLTLIEGDKLVDFNLYNNKLVDFNLYTTPDELNEHTRREMTKILQRDIEERTKLLQEFNKPTKKESSKSLQREEKSQLSH